MRAFLGVYLTLAIVSIAADSEILIQSSPLAGFRYYEGKAIWDEMKIGDALDLVREPDNPHDPRAVRVEWNSHKLGYLPRRENEAVARQLDLGNALQARIVKLRKHRDPWKRIEFEVVLKL